ncbi:MAG TPA: FIST N-terminal domain-containing protein, partial [Thermoanaerobaculia bacterium]|nr:FIST N-terminal domain-containing protein [Thermoanaerobaculia bacterium]
MLAFGASGLDPETAAAVELAERFPNSHVLGCSTAGEILGASVLDGSLVVAVLRFDAVRLHSAFAPVSSAGDSLAAGRALGAQLAGEDLRGVLVFADGIHVNGSELVRGISGELPRGIPVTGGLAGDGQQFRSTWVIGGGRSQRSGAAALGLYGKSLCFGHGSRGGWDIFGPERLVTRSQGNVLYELDGRPALALYKEYLGHRASGLPATALLFPLALRGQGGGQRIVRTVTGIDEDHQSMTFAGDIPQGCVAQLMKANFDRLIDGASDAALQTASQWEPGAPVLAIAVSCVGRRMVLGERCEEELEAVREVLPTAAQMIG